MVRRNGGIPKMGSSSKPKNYDLCHKCGKPGHFIKDCPLLKQDQYKHNPYKATKRNPVPDKRFKRKNVDDNVVKQALAAWGDSSSESEEDDDQGDSSMMAVESEAVEYDSIFALMAQSDDDENDNDDDEEKQNSRDDLVVVVVDLKETIEKHERDDLVVVLVDLKETIECVKNEKEALTKKVASIDHERDDLLVVVLDLKDTIEELKGEGRHKILKKGNEVADETHLRLEDEIKSVKSSLCVELEKNKQLQEELSRVKSDLEKSLKWTWSSEAITAMYTNNGGNMQGIRFQREKIPYNPHSKYVTGIVKGSDQQWYMDSGCSKHMTGRTYDFLSLKALQGGSVSFGNGKRGYILGVGRIGNKVDFVSKICTITNLVTGEVVLVAKRYKNIYVADFKSLQSGDLNCLSIVDDDVELWHRRLGHASFSLMNKLVKNDMVRGLPKSSFKDHKVCDACAKGKHVRSSFKLKKEVSTSRPLNLLHMDLCGPMRVPSRGGKRYIFVIVDDYSRFT
ncbi:uncharacterized protein [Nicotiana tomentosiformis]|uniref:uncharacterized protein n=1 Tax=Nicotiana tomentosiformis TaxID=4098 RepID=UPI00388C9701